MKRKVVKLGPATLVVSLPIKWTRAHNIDAGKELELKEDEGRLIIESEERKVEKREISITITNENKHNLKHILTHIYRKGFQKIIIRYETDISKEIRQFANDLLLGFEMTTKDDKHCILENLAEPTDQKYDILLKRLFFTIKETQKIILEGFENNNFSNFKDVEQLKDQQDKFVLFCKRILVSKDDKNLVYQYELLTFLMHIQHTYYYMYKYAYENKIKPDQKAIELQKDLIGYFELFFNAYFNKDMSAVNKIQKLKDDFQYGQCLKYLESSKGKNSIILSYERELFRLIQISTSPVIASIID